MAWLLDLFCGAGGASAGYVRAGFNVLGVDIKPQPNYPYDFIQADAMTFGVNTLWFDAVSASPPCQLFSRAGRLRDAQGGKASTTDLLTPTLERFRTLDIPWVVENVEGAKALMPGALKLCGSSFGLKVRRHRLFASNIPLTGLPCDHKTQGRPVGVYHVMNDNIPSGGRTARTLEEGQEAMGIDWMTWNELKESIPPAYTEHIGKQLMEHINNKEQAA